MPSRNQNDAFVLTWNKAQEGYTSVKPKHARKSFSVLFQLNKNKIRKKKKFEKIK